ncbi:GntR family transcriptional regulator [Sphaerisporangium perillae]|uniref:GntR family transcriptional regulator n=1 Tax=Sphaerisporangium perillae TaxID=2935860 RepID=UPI00200C1645|nr:GntR family transcriptional regulator [Sphaerisporangium perillae]
MGEREAGQTKRDRIVHELRSLIASGELPRGAWVRQLELAKRFSTSITPVREALRLLEAEGLVTAEPRRGVRVASADLEQVGGSYIARRLIEAYATQRAALRMSQRDLQKAQAYLDMQRQAYENGDRNAVLVANRSFHFHFFERSEIPSLVDIIDGLWTAFPWDVTNLNNERVEASLAEHAQILAMVRAGDLDAVGAAAAEHVKNSYLALVEHLTGKPAIDPFPVDGDVME